MEDLKQRTIRGGVAKIAGQAVNFVLRFAFIMIAARLLDPEDFGLVSMVTAVTGVYDLFSTGGLGSAVVQKDTITDEQVSTLFWYNILIGAALGALCLLTAPVLSSFYHEPRLVHITMVMAVGFLFTAAGAQHIALLQRKLRYVSLAAIEATSVTMSTLIAIAMAVAGFGYWALVLYAVVPTAINTVAAWTITAWVPGMPWRNVDVRSMLRYGGAMTLSGAVSYIAYNAEKVLIGRFWGAEALGIYGRGNQLANVPTLQLLGAIGGVAFAALSRVQNDGARLKVYFLKGLSLTVSILAPITLFSAAFAEDIILVVLGPKWTEATVIFRYLTPQVLMFALFNPLGWLLWSTGRQSRGFATTLVQAPLCIAAYVIGLPYGPSGVALAFSVVMTLWLVPNVLWCLKGTVVSPLAYFQAAWPPIASAAVAAAIALGAQFYFGQWQSPFLRLLFGGFVMASIYWGMLLFVMRQKSLYFNIYTQLRSAPSSSL